MRDAKTTIPARIDSSSDTFSSKRSEPAFNLASSKTEHSLGKEEAAGTLRSLVVLRASIRTDLHMLAPVEIQSR
jgi:hypothetical protein